MVNFNNPKVSVIIPTYNCAKYLGDAIASILNQTYHDYEIIVVDDGSTDETKNVLKPYAENIRYFYQDNQGVAVARNYGIAESKGKYIAFLDADDYFILQTKLSEQVNYFKTQPDIGIVHSGWQVVDENGNKIIDKPMWKQAPKLDLEAWLRNMCVRPSSMMFAKKWLQHIGGFRSEFSPAEDLQLVFALALNDCKCVWLPKITAAYRQHSNSLTANHIKGVNSIEKSLQWFFVQPNLLPKIAQLEKEVYSSTWIVYAWKFYRVKDFSKMLNYLYKALDYSPHAGILNIIIWLNCFKNLSLAETGEKLELSKLTNLREWQQLTQEITSKSKK